MEQRVKSWCFSLQDVQRFTLRTEHAACLVEVLVAMVSHTTAASKYAGQ